MSVSAFVPDELCLFEIAERTFHGAFGHFQVLRYRIDSRIARAVLSGAVAQIHVHRNSAVLKVCGIDVTIVKQFIPP